MAGKDIAVSTQIKAHGTAVGLPSDGDMGNSEVGHNTMAAGRVFLQGAKLINTAIETGKLYEGTAWMQLIGNKEHPGLALDPKKNRAVQPLYWSLVGWRCSFAH